jgi:rRNA maturation RNase YbeY
MALRFYEQEVRAKLKDKRRLSSFLQALIRRQKPVVKQVDLTYVFCGDSYLLEINREFLQHDDMTDIITFDMSEDPELMEGEIYISVERVKENSVKFGVSYEQELHRVIFHGALHLCGFKDKSPSEKKKMRQQEDLCLEQYYNQ